MPDRQTFQHSSTPVADTSMRQPQSRDDLRYLLNSRLLRDPPAKWTSRLCLFRASDAVHATRGVEPIPSGCCVTLSRGASPTFDVLLGTATALLGTACALACDLSWPPSADAPAVALLCLRCASAAAVEDSTCSKPTPTMTSGATALISLAGISLTYLL